MTLLLGAVGAFFAYAVGGLVGFASSLLFLPVLLLLDVPMWEAVGLNLSLAVLTRLPSVIALRSFVNVRRTCTMLAGAVPGIAVGLVVGDLVPAVGLEVAAGTLVVLSGWFLRRSRSLRRGRARPGTRSVLLAGACGGLLGVTTSLNGVPPAVLLARTGASVKVRLADMSVFFAVGNCLTIAAIATTRDLPPLHGSATVAAWLLAGMLGNAAGLRLAGSIDERRFNAITVWLVLLSGSASLTGPALDLLR